MAGETGHKESTGMEMQSQVPTFLGICRMLLAHAFPKQRSTLSVHEEEVLPYRASVLKALSALLESINVSMHLSRAMNKRNLPSGLSLNR